MRLQCSKLTGYWTDTSKMMGEEGLESREAEKQERSNKAKYILIYPQPLRS
jgi:hypothetical protein